MWLGQYVSHDGTLLTVQVDPTNVPLMLVVLDGYLLRKTEGRDWQIGGVVLEVAPVVLPVGYGVDSKSEVEQSKRLHHCWGLEGPTVSASIADYASGLNSPDS